MSCIIVLVSRTSPGRSSRHDLSKGTGAVVFCGDLSEPPVQLGGSELGRGSPHRPSLRDL
jgi:hypothetical protein